MADQKISELTALTGANVADDDAIAIVDTSATETKKIVFSELKNALDTATGFVRITGDTMTGNLSMGDNVKAIFGAGSDLQIYHDGTRSFIQDVNDGNLILDTFNGNEVNITSGGNAEFMVRAIKDGAVTLYYDNAPKLATTSTGIDVTGTVTSDGLTSTGSGVNTTYFTGGNDSIAGRQLTLSSEANGGQNNATHRLTVPSGYGSFNVSVNSAERLKINNNGDISFYEDTGTTAKFFWDASAERLGIGTSLPTQPVHLSNSSTAYYLAETTGTGTSAGFRMNGSASADYTLFTTQGTNQFAIYDNAAGSERLRITSNGSVGINTTSPATELDVQGTTTTNGLNLDALAATISDTAVDLFVYDTRKDSDGGAWRKRTQHTSWYNETLNTATRGSRKEFPAVAVIVAETNQVTIYDGDDPDLPMWMVFNSGSGTMIRNINGSCTALNANLVVGATDYDLFVVNFIKDNREQHYTSGTLTYNLNIAGRNVTGTGNTEVASGAIISRATNDVAMTVLPNAPIDAATGLPVPTIAVATDGGTSIIRDDGTVDNHSDTKSNTAIEILGTNYAILRNATGVPLEIAPLNGAGAAIMNYRDDGVNLGSYYPQLMVGFDPTSTAKNAYGAGKGLNILDDDILSTSTIAQPLGKVAYITSDYNTGWQNGDIKLATLSDTDDTDVTGSELVTNGTFDSDVSGWSTPVSGYTTFTWSSGTLQHVASGGTGRVRSPAIAVVAGKTYTFSVEVTAKTADSGSFVHLGTSAGASNIKNNITQGEAVGTSAHTFTATTSSVFIELGAISGNTVNYDNVSLRLAEEDRSVNGNGLQVFGTVTKNPVATGADLVAYSGFSTSNYLEQPYNSDLDWGTSDFVVMGWENHSTTAGQTLINIGDVGSNNSFDLRVQNNVYNAGYLSVANAFASTYSITPSAPSGTWNHVAVVHTGGLLHFYVNGVHSGSWTDSNINWTTHWTTRQVIIGIRGELSTPANATSMALWRISATAPSPEQIKKIYEDEKVLFQDGAQATLYGSSDAVTALAYDDSTEILSVGTSAGRSDFQGLRRVNNTTNAVGAAISASNGMIVEE